MTIVGDATTAEYMSAIELADDPGVRPRRRQRLPGITDRDPVSDPDAATADYEPAERPHDPFVEHYRKLQSLSTLQGGANGTEAPNRASVNNATRVLSQLARLGLAPNRVMASAEGGVVLCFFNGDKYADIECFNTGTVLAGTSDRKGEPSVWTVPQTLSGLIETAKRIRDYIRP